MSRTPGSGPRQAGTAAGSIGPGAFVAVVGPSGAGKDTLIELARQRLGDDARCLFPRRIITRPADAGAEDHDSVSAGEFARLKAAGGLALSWHAHGLDYGIPIAADRAIKAGAVVVCNVSRAVLAEASGRYARLEVMRITAPEAVLADRLAARGRETRADIERRLARADGPLPPVGEGVVVNNVGTPAQGAEPIVALVQRLIAEAAGRA